MPTVDIQESPLLPGVSPVPIFYREYGSGNALIFLHGGWGYSIYPFEKQVEALSRDFRVIIPDRTGYGRSMRVSEWPVDFHARAAQEVIRFLDALKIDRAIFWGHSDGAVISAMLGIDAPGEVPRNHTRSLSLFPAQAGLTRILRYDVSQS